MAKLISKTYAGALFELAVEENKVDELVAQAIAILKIFEDDKDFMKFMNHPQIDKEEKIKLIDSAFSKNASDEITGFIKVIVEKDRFGQIVDIFKEFVHEIREYKGIGEAYVSTPMPLTEIQKSDIKDKLLATTGYKEIDLKCSIDESLIGGMVIRIGDRIVDSSIKRQLVNLKTELKNIQIKS